MILHQQRVFCIIYSTDSKPYENYNEVSDDVRNLKLPFALMNMRWDGKIGFYGGMVDEDETVMDALVRELKEELDFTHDNNDEFKLINLEQGKGFSNYLFKLQVPFEKLKEIQKNSVNSEHFVSESLGSIFAPLFNTGNNEIYNFLEHSFSGTAKKELNYFYNNEL